MITVMTVERSRWRMSLSHGAAVCLALMAWLGPTGTMLTAQATRPLDENRPLAGRLATVEPAARRLTVVADGAETLTEVLVQEGTEVMRGTRPISLSELVTFVGSRVIVLYHVENGVRLPSSVTVEESTPPPTPANAPIPRA
jgi:hypothetical protein